MSNRQPRRPAASTTYPAHPVTAASSPARPADRPGTEAPTHLRTKGRPTRQAPSASTDRPTATFPTATFPTALAGHPLAAGTGLPEGWRVDPRPRRYLDPADAADASRLAPADATPTGVFPIRRSIRPGARPTASPGAPDRPQREGAGRPARGGGGQADAASLSHGGARARAGARAVYHTAPAYPSSEQAATSGAGRRQARRRHLRAAMTGIALAAAVLTGLQLYALDGIIDAREAARAARAARPVASTSQPAPSTGSMSGQTPMPERAPENARTGIQSAWVTEDTGAPYSKDDPAASPLSLPRCTTSPDTPMPCLAHVSADSNHAVVLEEDASLTGLVRQ